MMGISNKLGFKKSFLTKNKGMQRQNLKKPPNEVGMAPQYFSIFLTRPCGVGAQDVSQNSGAR